MKQNNIKEIENIIKLTHLSHNYKDLDELMYVYKGLVKELTTLIDKVREEAVRDFAEWYDQDVFPEKGYAESSLDRYLESIEDIK